MSSPTIQPGVPPWISGQSVTLFMQSINHAINHPINFKHSTSSSQSRLRGPGAEGSASPRQCQGHPAAVVAAPQKNCLAAAAAAAAAALQKCWRYILLDFDFAQINPNYTECGRLHHKIRWF